MINVLYIEDEEKEIMKFRDKLVDDKEIRFIIKKPNEWKTYLSEKQKIDLILIDYWLTNEIESTDFKFPLFGGGMANYFRENLQNYPLVLITRRKNIPVNIMDLFDWNIKKSKIYSNVDDFKSKILEISDSFKVLRELKERNRDAIFKVLNVKNDIEYDLLLESNLPSGKDNLLYSFEGLKAEDIAEDISFWNISNFTSWVLNTIFAYPGILYSPIFAATILRISEKSFLSEEIQNIFKNAKYNGIFSKMKDRWWKNRIEFIAYQYLRDSECEEIDLINFPEIFEKKTGIDVEIAQCIVCDNKADTVCYVLNKPVCYKHSIAYYPDNRPRIMEIARLSYQAILEGTNFHRSYTLTENENIIENIDVIMREIRKKRD